MSLKLTTFATALPAPKTSEKFLVQLPNLKQSLLRVSAASLPYAKRDEGAIWLLGRPLYLPKWTDQSGEWTCTITEDMAMSASIQITALERHINNLSVENRNIHIYITDQITGLVPHLAVTLRYVWLKSVTPLSLDWSKPEQVLSYQLIFKFSGLKRWI